MSHQDDRVQNLHPRRRAAGAVLLTVLSAIVVALAMAVGSAASASQPSVGLGTAKTFAVLAGTTVTNTGPSVISGDLGVSPGKAVTGFPPGTVIHGTQHKGDAVALKAQTYLTTAYNDAAGRNPATAVKGDLGGTTLAPGIYRATSGLGLTGTVTLDAHNDPNAVFVFQAGSTLITASSSTVKLVGGAQACNVFWQVGSSATLGTHSVFVGTILALTSATVQTGTAVDGRVLARNGQVSLDSNTITVPTSCINTPPTTSTSSSTTTTTPSSTSTSTTSAGASTTTAAPRVPSAPTGEPWSGWPYWALVGVVGLFGVASVDRAVRFRRRRASGV
jgi:hypothetical protein